MGQTVDTGTVAGAVVGAAVVGGGDVVGAGVAGTMVVVVASTVDVATMVVEVEETDDETVEPDELPLSSQLAMAKTTVTAHAVANVRPPLIALPLRTSLPRIGILTCR